MVLPGECMCCLLRRESSTCGLGGWLSARWVGAEEVGSLLGYVTAGEGGGEYTNCSSGCQSQRHK